MHVPLKGNENVPIACSDGCTTLWIYQTLLNYIFFKRMNWMVCELHFKKAII